MREEIGRHRHGAREELRAGDRLHQHPHVRENGQLAGGPHRVDRRQPRVQGRFHDDIKTFFEDALAHDFQGVVYSGAETVDGDHGRIELRRAWATEDIAWTRLAWMSTDNN